MTEQETDNLLSTTVRNMVKLGIDGQEHLEGTPLITIFLGISAALEGTMGEMDNDDLKDSSVNLLEALASVIDSSRLISEIDMQNQINDLLK